MKTSYLTIFNQLNAINKLSNHQQAILQGLVARIDGLKDAQWSMSDAIDTELELQDMQELLNIFGDLLAKRGYNPKDTPLEADEAAALFDDAFEELMEKYRNRILRVVNKKADRVIRHEGRHEVKKEAREQRNAMKANVKAQQHVTSLNDELAKSTSELGTNIDDTEQPQQSTVPGK